MVNLLVVHRQKGVSALLRDFFEKRGHRVFSVKDAHMIMAVLAKKRTRVVIFEVFDAESVNYIYQATQTYGEEMKIIVIGGDSRLGTLAMHAGAQAYLEIPFSMDDLETQVMLAIQGILIEV